MNKYNVHVFAIVRIKLPKVAAKTPEAAAEKAESLMDGIQLRSLFSHECDGNPIECTELVEELPVEYLVDKLRKDGDVDYKSTCWLDEKFQRNTRKVLLNQAEVANILVALQYMQAQIAGTKEEAKFISGISTFTATGEKLFTAAEIDALCLRLNTP